MPHGEHWDMFADIADINAWLDAANGSGFHEDAMRVLKVFEEAGETAAAYIGMTGQNPRKGITHTQNDLLAELADVAITALAAIQHFTRSRAQTEAVMASKITAILSRANIRQGRPRLRANEQAPAPIGGPAA